MLDVVLDMLSAVSDALGFGSRRDNTHSIVYLITVVLVVFSGVLLVLWLVFR